MNRGRHFPPDAVVYTGPDHSPGVPYGCFWAGPPGLSHWLMWLLQFHCCRSPCPPTGVPPRCPESMELLESNLPWSYGSGPDAPAYHGNPPPDAAWYSAPLGAGHFLLSSHCASRMGMNLDMTGIDHQPLEIRLIYYIQQLCPDAPVPPTAKTAMSVLPVPVIRGQVPSGCPGAQNPKCPIQKQPVVEGWPTHLTCPPANGVSSNPRPCPLDRADDVMLPYPAPTTLLQHQLTIIFLVLTTPFKGFGPSLCKSGFLSSKTSRWNRNA